ncbi:MAG TPA: penicillin-binding transpeptidase domain-containing protein [Candidatus Ozemobacteraceae bacterium]|nr:penicillin-binding transpeptidase domain-containing protein [Candidatus Ozemobacteraceae bacterium]
MKSDDGEYFLRGFSGKSGALVLLLALCALFAAGGAFAKGNDARPIHLKNGVIIESIDAGHAAVVEGDAGLASHAACPASTFKLVIAWAGLETGRLQADTRIECREDRIASGMIALDLHNALIRSSNRYFEVVAGRIGIDRLAEYVRKSGLVAGEVPKNWLKQGVAAAIWGGDLRVTPFRLHDLMVRLSAGSLASRAVSEALVAAIEWPAGTSGMRVYGKSGTMRGAAWFTGFAREKSGRTRVVTVFLRGGSARKSEAAERFFGRFGMKPPVLPPLGMN